VSLGCLNTGAPATAGDAESGSSCALTRVARTRCHGLDLGNEQVDAEPATGAAGDHGSWGPRALLRHPARARALRPGPTPSVRGTEPTLWRPGHHSRRNGRCVGSRPGSGNGAGLPPTLAARRCERLPGGGREQALRRPPSASPPPSGLDQLGQQRADLFWCRRDT